MKTTGVGFTILWAVLSLPFLSCCQTDQSNIRNTESTGMNAKRGSQDFFSEGQVAQNPLYLEHKKWARDNLPFIPALLEWPFDTSVELGGIGFIDLDKPKYLDYSEKDNLQFLAYTGLSFDFTKLSRPPTKPPKVIKMEEDTGNYVIMADGHGGFDLFFPPNTNFISKWDTEVIYQKNVVFISLYQDRLRIYIGHVKPNTDRVLRSAGIDEPPDQIRVAVKKGDVIATVTKESTSHDYLHRNGKHYYLAHIEVWLFAPVYNQPKGLWSGVGFNRGPGDPDPVVEMTIPLEKLNFFGGHFPYMRYFNPHDMETDRF